MIWDLFFKPFGILLKYRKEKIADDSDMVQIRKRLLLHKGIPELEVVRQKAGERFEKLLAIVNAADPVRQPKLSENPNKYLLFTKTLIYRLPKQKSREEVSDLLLVEFSLWFKHAYNDYKQKEELSDIIYDFKKRYFVSDPFREEPER